MLSSEHVISVEHMHSQQMWLLRQDLYKIKPVKNYNMDWGGGPQSPGLAEKPLVIMTAWEAACEATDRFFSLEIESLVGFLCPH